MPEVPDVKKEIEKKIEELAKDAGKREAARALGGGASAAEANRREREQRAAVKGRLTTRFKETGQLPVARIGRLYKEGRIAPPVITLKHREAYGQVKRDEAQARKQLWYWLVALLSVGMFMSLLCTLALGPVLGLFWRTVLPCVLLLGHQYMLSQALRATL